MNPRGHPSPNVGVRFTPGENTYGVTVSFTTRDNVHDLLPEPPRSPNPHPVTRGLVDQLRAQIAYSGKDRPERVGDRRIRH
jgi:hypothetical protein